MVGRPAQTRKQLPRGNAGCIPAWSPRVNVRERAPLTNCRHTVCSCVPNTHMYWALLVGHPLWRIRHRLENQAHKKVHPSLM